MLRTILRRRVAILAVIAVAAAGIASVSASSATAAIPSQYHVDTGWVAFNGGCLAHTDLYYWPASNTVQMKTDVYSPYWFAACRVNAHPIFDTAFGPINDGPTQYNFACAVLDPTCASTRYGGWETTVPASATLAFVQNVFHADLSQVVSGIRIQQTAA
jgi:hypothetical protein